MTPSVVSIRKGKYKASQKHVLLDVQIILAGSMCIDTPKLTILGELVGVGLVIHVSHGGNKDAWEPVKTIQAEMAME